MNRETLTMSTAGPPWAYFVPHNIARGAGTADPDIASASREGEARRRRGQAQLIRRWKTAGALRPGLTTREAADVLWAMTGPDVYRLFVTESRWSLKRYQGWLTTTLEGALLSIR